jgi:ribonuclease D
MNLGGRNLRPINNEEEVQMSKVKPGDVLSCEVCGLAVIVDEECGCAIAELICCEEPMENKGPRPPKKAVAAPQKKAVIKKVKPVAKKAAPKKAAKKPVVKKKSAKK